MKHGLLWFTAMTLAALTAVGQPEPTPDNELRACEAINNTSGAKVILSQIEYTLSDGTSGIMTDDYDIGIQMAVLQALGNLFDSDEIKSVLCGHRTPKSDGSDFDDSEYVKVLIGRDVLMEMWGKIRERSSASGPSFKADLLIMIMPARAYRDVADGLDFHMLRSTIEQTDDVEEAFVDIAFGDEFEAYLCLAQALRAFANEEFDGAKSYVAKARLVWQAALEAGRLPSMEPTSESVLNHILNLENKIVEAAASSGSYSGDAVLVNSILEKREP